MNKQRCFCCGEVLNPDETTYHKKCLKALFRTKNVPTLNLSQAELNRLAASTVSRRISIPGVQPKLSLHLERGSSRERLTLVGLEGDYILKPQAPQWHCLPEAEHFCMMLAKRCKISVAEFGLIPMQDSGPAYITRRMDRTDNGMLHMEDFCQILEKSTSQKYNGSMEQIGKALRKYSSAPGLDSVRLFELTLFCFLTGNSDMHLKNFSLIQSADDQYVLSPAYDLVPVQVIMPADTEETALSVCGKKKRLRCEDFMRLGTAFQLTDVQIEKTIRRIVNFVGKNLIPSLEASFLPQNMQEQIRHLVTDRLARFPVNS